MTSATACARQERYLSTTVVAGRLQLAARTVRLKIESGQIPAVRTGDAGKWRVPASWLHGELSRIGAVIRRPPPKTHNG